LNLGDASGLLWVTKHITGPVRLFRNGLEYCGQLRAQAGLRRSKPDPSCAIRMGRTRRSKRQDGTRHRQPEAIYASAFPSLRFPGSNGNVYFSANLFPRPLTLLDPLRMIASNSSNTSKCSARRQESAGPE